MKSTPGFIYDEARACPECHYITLSYGLSGKCAMCPYRDKQPEICLEERRGVPYQKVVEKQWVGLGVRA